MEEFISVFNDMRSEIDRLSEEVESLNLVVGPKFQIGVVKETLTAGDFGWVQLKSPVFTTAAEDDDDAEDGWELKEKRFKIKVFNPAEEDVEVDEVVTCGRNQWGKWIHIVGGGGDAKPVIIPVVLEKISGDQGDGENPATWQYDAYKAPKESGDEVILDDVDPVASPHHYARPNVGQVEPADFGLAWQIKKDPPPPEPEEGEDPEDPYEYELTWINEAIIGAICEEGEECPEGQTWNPETGECEDNCPEGQTWNPDTGECEETP